MIGSSRPPYLQLINSAPGSATKARPLRQRLLKGDGDIVPLSGARLGPERTDYFYDFFNSRQFYWRSTLEVCETVRVLVGTGRIDRIRTTVDRAIKAADRHCAEEPRKELADELAAENNSIAEEIMSGDPRSIGTFAKDEPVIAAWLFCRTLAVLQADGWNDLAVLAKPLAYYSEVLGQELEPVDRVIVLQMVLPLIAEDRELLAKRLAEAKEALRLIRDPVKKGIESLNIAGLLKGRESEEEERFFRGEAGAAMQSTLDDNIKHTTMLTKLLICNGEINEACALLFPLSEAVCKIDDKLERVNGIFNLSEILARLGLFPAIKYLIGRVSD
ncbi:MAG: hypothetical protein WCW67_05205 [Candidatus Margulisiibacteriota bacterium]|jgi:hypothetical protein